MYVKLQQPSFFLRKNGPIKRCLMGPSSMQAV